ncbi:MAG: FtsW/RodA/SpoVE family cell cycle protein, partial [Candidatus Omnitrophica bacterium]|nr:FtsW/RodA/SpoVE family cell cycle protein [Candidatus Omnitrophota bacterium]
MVYSSSAIFAYEQFKDSTYFLKRHLFYLMLGLILAVVTMAFDYKKLQKTSKPLIFFSILLLVIILLKGKEIGGAKRWFRLGQFSFQPSELAKISLIIYLSDILTRKQTMIASFFRGFFPPAMIAGAVILLIMAQPDLG